MHDLALDQQPALKGLAGLRRKRGLELSSKLIARHDVELFIAFPPRPGQ